jgi:23S rRNA (pseudouridine1915-N3)-methyltransferase
MKISIIAVGRISNSFESELVNRYIYRFNKLNKLIGLSLMQIIEVDDKKYKTKKQQAKKILDITKAETNIVIFDQIGKSISSENFTKYLTNQRDSGVKKLVFIIGGAFGLCSSLYKESNEIFSLGKMIWPHFLVRVMVTEQIYRSASIIVGNPYHKN